MVPIFHTHPRIINPAGPFATSGLTHVITNSAHNPTKLCIIIMLANKDKVVSPSHSCLVATAAIA